MSFGLWAIFALDFTAGGEGEHSGFTAEALVTHG